MLCYDSRLQSYTAGITGVSTNYLSNTRNDFRGLYCLMVKILAGFQAHDQLSCDQQLIPNMTILLALDFQIFSYIKLKTASLITQKTQMIIIIISHTHYLVNLFTQSFRFFFSYQFEWVWSALPINSALTQALTYSCMMGEQMLSSKEGRHTLSLCRSKQTRHRFLPPGRLGPMVTCTLKLGISILNGGNVQVQQVSLNRCRG